jgi:hypothetical protein
MILEISRSRVRAEIGGKTVTIEGEGYLKGYGSPDFVMYKNSLQRWDPPDDGETIDEAMRQTILNGVKAEMESEKGMTVEIE